MKNRKFIPLILYLVILVAVFSWAGDLFGENLNQIPYSQVVELFAKCGDLIDIYSGEDALTVPMMSMGAKGTISVVSNVAPKESVAMTDAAAAGDFKTAAEMQCKLLPLINALFCEVNPIPAKAGVAALGFGENYLRMPLTPMEPQNEERLLNEMKKLGVIA